MAVYIWVVDYEDVKTSSGLPSLPDKIWQVGIHQVLIVKTEIHYSLQIRLLRIYNCVYFLYHADVLQCIELSLMYKLHANVCCPGDFSPTQHH